MNTYEKWLVDWFSDLLYCDENLPCNLSDLLDQYRFEVKIIDKEIDRLNSMSLEFKKERDRLSMKIDIIVEELSKRSK